MIIKILNIGILFLPFFTFSSRFEIPKVVYFLCLTLLISIWCYFNIFKKKTLIFNKADYLYLLWIAVLFISSIFGIHPELSIFGGSYRNQGVIFFFALWIITKYVFVLDVKNKHLLINGFTLSGLIQVLILIYQYIGKIGLLNGRPVGTFGNPNSVAGYLVLLLPFIFMLIDKERRFKNIIVLQIPIIFLGIVLTQSRAGLVGFAVVVCLYTGYKLKEKLSGGIKKLLTNSNQNLIRISVQGIIYILVIGIGIYMFVSVFERSKTRNDSVFENRYLFIQMALNNIAKKPILGYGAESSEQLFDQSYKVAEMPLEGMIVDRSHNLILDLLMWSGIWGLGTFALWALEIIKTKLKNKDYYLIFGLIGFFVFAFLQPLGVTHWLLLMILVSVN